jgi:hypothetical protein
MKSNSVAAWNGLVIAKLRQWVHFPTMDAPAAGLSFYTCSQP